MGEFLESIFAFCEALGQVGPDEKRLALCLGTVATAYILAKSGGGVAELVELESVCLAITLRASRNGGTFEPNPADQAFSLCPNCRAQLLVAPFGLDGVYCHACGYRPLIG